jgi:hypothetical protein
MAPADFVIMQLSGPMTRQNISIHFLHSLVKKQETRSAMNAFRLFARYMNPDYKPIPSSIIDQGDGEWHGAKDRGDMAMIRLWSRTFCIGIWKKRFGNCLMAIDRMVS